MIQHTATTCPTDRAAPVLYRLDADPAIRWARASELAWGQFADDQGAGRIAEWAPLIAGPWRLWDGAQHAAIELPVLGRVLVEVRLADDEPGLSYLDEADRIAWAGVDGVGAVASYRTWTPMPRTAPTRPARTRRLRALPRRSVHARGHAPTLRRLLALHCPWWAM